MRGKWSWLNNPSHDFPVWYHCISKRKDRQRCMAAFFGWKMGKQKIRKWRNIKTTFLARTPANLKHKTAHVPFNTEVIFIKFNPLSCIFCLFVLIICLWVCSIHACLQIRMKAFPLFLFTCLFWTFVLPNKLHSRLFCPWSDRKQSRALCAALWLHFLCLWGMCACHEL